MDPNATIPVRMALRWIEEVVAHNAARGIPAASQNVTLTLDASDVEKGLRDVTKRMAPTKAAALNASPRATKTATPGRRGRSSVLHGKYIYPKVAENPRREGTKGHDSMALILKRPGMKGTEFVSRGGRLEDLRYDIEHGHVEVVDVKRGNPEPVDL